MDSIFKVHFVCTGNVFRSMSAELFLKRYLKEINDDSIKVSSSGIKPGISSCQETRESLLRYNIDITKHIPQKSTKELLQKQDLIIAMTNYHKTVIKYLGFESILFNKIAFNKDEDLYDFNEYSQHYNNLPLFQNYIDSVIDHIHGAIPIIYNKIKARQNQIFYINKLKTTSHDKKTH